MVAYHFLYMLYFVARCLLRNDSVNSNRVNQIVLQCTGTLAFLLSNIQGVLLWLTNMITLYFSVMNKRTASHLEKQLTLIILIW